MDASELAESVAWLVDIEKIKQLKARYFRLMDERMWDEWSDVFTEGCRVEASIPDQPGKMNVWEGREVVVEALRWALAGETFRGKIVGSATVHMGHMPEIAITGPGRATGRWAGSMDYLQPTIDPMAIEIGPSARIWYDEDYETDAQGVWRIARMQITLRTAAALKDRPTVDPGDRVRPRVESSQ